MIIAKNAQLFKRLVFTLPLRATSERVVLRRRETEHGQKDRIETSSYKNIAKNFLVLFF